MNYGREPNRKTILSYESLKFHLIYSEEFRILPSESPFGTWLNGMLNIFEISTVGYVSHDCIFVIRPRFRLLSHLREEHMNHDTMKYTVI